MASSITKSATEIVSYDGTSHWSPSGIAAVAGVAAPVGSSGIAPQVCTLDNYSRNSWAGFVAYAPSMSIPATSTLLGLRWRIYGQKSSAAGSVSDGFGDQASINSGVVGCIAGTPDVSALEGFESLIGSPRSHIDNLPIGSGNVSNAEYIEIGGPTELFGQSASALRDQLNANGSGQRIGLLADFGVYVSSNLDVRSENHSAATVSKLLAGNWTGDPTVVIPANTIANAGSGWASKAVHNFTNNGDAFGGLACDFGSISLAADLVVTGVGVKVYGQAVGATVGRVNVDATSGGSKTVQHAGKMGITVGSAVSYANLLANGGGKTRQGHIDNLPTASGNITLARSVSFGDNGVIGDMFNFSDSDSIKAALLANSGSTKIGFFIDDGLWWKDTVAATREIAAVVLSVYGHGPGDVVTREIACVECTAFYSNASLVDTCSEICARVFNSYRLSASRHGIRFYVPASSAPNAWAVVDPAVAGNSSTVYNNQFEFDVDCSSYAKAQRSALELADKLNDYRVGSIDCSSFAPSMGVREVDPPA